MTTTNRDTSPNQLLQRLGFTEYEAQAYVTLVEHGELSGYELAKRSGIPRANVYAVIDKLLERGAVLQAQGEKGPRYAAVPSATLLHSMDAEHKRSLNAADKALAGLAQAETPASVFNLGGEQLLDQARQLIDACAEHLLIAIQPAEASALAPALQQARARGVEIVTLCLEACEQPCGGCQGKLHRHALAPGDGSRWLLLVMDGHKALVGRFGEATREGLVTAQSLVVELTNAYIHQSIALATLGDELAGRFDGLLSEQAVRLLYPEGAATDR
jgi:DNA-binding MarR family transcriptional regulator